MDVAVLENLIWCPSTDNLKPLTYLLPLDKMPWNLLGFVSIVLSQNQRTVTSASNCNSRFTMFHSLLLTEAELSSRWASVY